VHDTNNTKASVAAAVLDVAEYPKGMASAGQLRITSTRIHSAVFQFLPETPLVDPGASPQSAPVRPMRTAEVRHLGHRAIRATVITGCGK
jgi:hypothetical protein